MFVYQAALVFLFFIITQNFAFCSGIIGQVKERNTQRPMSSVAVRAYEDGRSMASAAVSDNDGKYLITDLKPGRYAVCVGATDISRPQVTSVIVPEKGNAEVNFSLSPSVKIEGDSWLQGYPVFYQSFQAVGLGLTGLKLKAYGPNRAVKVEVLEGEGPSGKPVGKSRITVPFGGEGEATVLWTGGEVPTIPGKTYTFKLSAPDGQTWIPGVAGRGDVYPDGQAYFGKNPRPFSDLGFAVFEENDSLSTSFAVAAGQRTILVRSVGQSFIARSKNILLASIALSSAVPKTVFVRISIHENGPGGKQIGSSKGIQVGGDAIVAWLPGEVQVIPGKKYYLHAESYDGTRFYAYEELDPYAKGAAFNDAVMDRRYDIAGWVVGELSESDQARLLKCPKSIKNIPLVNASFEQDLSGWTTTKSFGNAVGCDCGVLPSWGEKMFGWTNKGKGENSRTIIYQNVKVIKGKHYAFSGSVYTDHQGGRSSDQKIRLVVDTAGKAKFDNSMESSQWYATEGAWRRGSVEFIAASNSVSVGFEMEQRWSLDCCSLYTDGARLDQIAED